MLTPEDWRSWSYVSRSATPGAGIFDARQERLWRITVTAGGGGATLAVGSADLVSPPLTTLAANATITLEPRGMCPALVAYSGVTSLVVESIVKR